jgi:hypothetical protein
MTHHPHNCQTIACNTKENPEKYNLYFFNVFQIIFHNIFSIQKHAWQIHFRIDIPKCISKTSVGRVKKRKNKSINSLETINALKKKARQKNIDVGIENTLLIKRENKLKS